MQSSFLRGNLSFRGEYLPLITNLRYHSSTQWEHLAFSPAILVFLKGISFTYYAQIILKSLGGIWIIGHFVKDGKFLEKQRSFGVWKSFTFPPDLFATKVERLRTEALLTGPLRLWRLPIGWRKIQQGSCKWFFLHAWLVHNFPVFLYHGNLYKGPTRPHSPMPYAPESWWLITLRWGGCIGGHVPFNSLAIGIPT